MLLSTDTATNPAATGFNRRLQLRGQAGRPRVEPGQRAGHFHRAGAGTVSSVERSAMRLAGRTGVAAPQADRSAGGAGASARVQGSPAVTPTLQYVSSRRAISRGFRPVASWKTAQFRAAGRGVARRAS